MTDAADWDQDESAEDERDLAPREDDEAATTTVDWTVETVVSQMRKGRIDLTPNFQRRDAWTRIAKSRYIESLVQRYPVPQIVLAEDPKRPGRYLVIDGKQRLLAIRQFCADSNDPRDTDWLEEKIKLTGLTEAIKLNGKTYETMEEEYPSETMRFENATIRAVLLRKWHSQDFLYTVFYRLNSGSLKLSAQELRQALYPGAFMEYIDSYSGTSPALRWLLNKPKPDRRMVDAELLLRFLSFHMGIEQYDGNLKNFLDHTAEKLSTRWDAGAEFEVQAATEAMERAIFAAREIFSDKVCRKFSAGKFERSVNRALFDVQIHYLTDSPLRDWQVANPAKTVALFQELCRTDPEFIDAVSSTTKTPYAVYTRFNAWGTKLAQASGIPHKFPPAVPETLG
ncbi:hypothetical protein Psi02_15290 [Planotetraspora silvatica]|uniref:GmrSD restriction endonucleases N-terminal domain-containing protein n=1 Tax=Planotetraspora silvatica TaxID=234614 RepID=A0A8J3UV57_9ACTN|nr:DUF262 domain-containing protein [Planotetraspora silvatica]GII45105.1 hypothetical protein Psi02_15290 [Planotetraspora silvatica]